MITCMLRRAARPRLLATLVAALALTPASCSDDGTGPDPDAVATIALAPDAPLLASLGDTLQLQASPRNAGGSAVATTVSWSSDDASVATVDGSGRAVAIANGVATIRASAGGIEGTLALTVEQRVDSMEIAGDRQSADINQPLDSAVAVTLLDARGNPIAGAPVRFTVLSGGGSVSPGEATSDAGGTAAAAWTLGMTAGPQELDVSAGFSGEGTLELAAMAFPLPPDTLVLLAGDGQSELADHPLPLPLQVQVLDSLGNGVPDVPVLFTVEGGATLDAEEVATDVEGVAAVHLTLGAALGSYAITARAVDQLTQPEEEDGEAPDVPGSPLAFTAHAVELALASPSAAGVTVGDTAVLTGSGFHPDPQMNSVTVGGVPAVVVDGTSSELRVVVPSFGCTPAAERTIELTRGGETRVREALVVPAGALALAPGERRVLSDPASFCLQFLSGPEETYLVGLTATRWLAAEAGFTMTGLEAAGPDPAPALLATAASPARSVSPLAMEPSATAAVPAAPPGASLPLRAGSYAGSAGSAGTRASASPAEREAGLRAWETSLVERLPASRSTPVPSPTERGGTPSARGAPGPLFGVSASAQLSASQPPVKGDVLELRLPDLGGDPCTDWVPLAARVLSAGERLVLATNVDLPQPPDPQLEQLEEALDALQSGFGGPGIQTLLDHFGLPPGWAEGNGLTVVFAPEVAGVGVPVFSTLVDHLPRSTCAASDERPVVYVAVPADPDLSDLAALLPDVPPKLAHELVHVIQSGRRLAAGAPLLPAWIGEGQAQLGVEVAGMALHGLASGENLGLEAVTSSGAEAWLAERFDFLSLFQGWDGEAGALEGAPERCSLFGFASPDVPCRPGYGAGAAWSFIRYLSDRFGVLNAGGEAGFQKGLIDLDPAGDPMSLLQQLTGATAAELIVDWATMLYVDGRLSPSEAPGLVMTSWDLDDIIPEGPRRLNPHAFPFEGFVRGGSVAGGGTAYSLLSSEGNRGPLAVEVLGPSGGPVAQAIAPRLWVIRIR